MTEQVSPQDDLLHFDRVFSSGISPFDEVEWETRSTEITDDSGKVIFKQDNVEVPKTWSDLATKVVVSKYFYGENGTEQRERSVRQLISRVVDTITIWGVKDGYFDASAATVFSDELTWLCLNQHVAFNSPVWFNVGLWEAYNVGGGSSKGGYYWNKAAEIAQQASTQYEKPQCSACFIQSVEDNMESIMELAVSEAMLFKFGSGTGTDLSTIRSLREKLSGGGRPSGPMSFLRIYDQVANVVKSGGKTRRAAKMNTLNTWHGDIEEFIDAKMKEEKKAWALIEQGYEGNFNGDAYGSVMYQNENLSVRASDDFMNKASGAEADSKYWTSAVTTNRPLEHKDAKLLMDKIAEGAWTCGDPGMQFNDTIQRWHTCAGTDQIHSTNPCSEYVFLDNTACNLASINLMKFQSAASFQVARFQAAVRILITAQEIMVDNASYPTPEIATNSHIFRTLGLGYANLGALLMSCGMPYDSENGRHLAAGITSLMTGEAYAQSARIAAVKGAFPGYSDSCCAGIEKPATSSNVGYMMRVMRLHQACAAKKLYGLGDAKVWDEAIRLGGVHGFRNAQVTVLAPTGTIAFMMDCDTTGIEPDIALVKYKVLAGGGNLKITNKSVEEALRRIGYESARIPGILSHIGSYDTVEDVTEGGVLHQSGLKPEHLAVFDCAFKPAKGQRSIDYMAHLKMMAAVQPFLSGAISKTVNMPNSASVADVRNAFIQAWRMGLKCVAIYRDGSKRSQPLNTAKEEKTCMSPPIKLAKPDRMRMPETRKALTHKFDIAGHEGYLTVGFFDDGRIGELFVQMAKEGSTIGGLMDTIGTLVSISLQYGVPLSTLVEKFKHQRFEPSGWTSHKEIKQASSIIDYVFRWMQTLEPNRVELPAPESIPMPITLKDSLVNFQADAPACPRCGHIVVRNASCYKCLNCGESLGCS